MSRLNRIQHVGCKLGNINDFGNILNPNFTMTTYIGKYWNLELAARYWAGSFWVYKCHYTPRAKSDTAQAGFSNTPQSLAFLTPTVVK
jgi:hypothetical protein